MLALFSLSSQPVTSCLLASRKCCVDRLRPPEFEEMTQFTGFQRARRSRFRGHFLHSGWSHGRRNTRRERETGSVSQRKQRGSSRNLLLLNDLVFRFPLAKTLNRDCRTCRKLLDLVLPSTSVMQDFLLVGEAQEPGRVVV